MSLKQRLLDDLKAAMKEKDELKKDVIQLVRAAILQVEKDKKTTLDDDGIIEVLAKEVKKRNDSLPEFEKSGRQDLIDKLNAEIQLLMQYLPKQLSESELREIVKESIAETSASSVKDMGKVMQSVMPKVKGRADGKLVNAIVKEMLS